MTPSQRTRRSLTSSVAHRIPGAGSRDAAGSVESCGWAVLDGLCDRRPTTLEQLLRCTLACPLETPLRDLLVVMNAAASSFAASHVRNAFRAVTLVDSDSSGDRHPSSLLHRVQQLGDMDVWVHVMRMLGHFARAIEFGVVDKVQGFEGPYIRARYSTCKTTRQSTQRVFVCVCVCVCARACARVCALCARIFVCMRVCSRAVHAVTHTPLPSHAHALPG